MRVLVFGGLGNYSVRITERLAQEHDVSVFELKDAKPTFSCQLLTGNVLDADSVANACEGHDAIITFAVGNLEVSVDGIKNILEGASKTGVARVAYTSSGGISFPIPVFGDHPRYNAAFFNAEFWDGFFPIYEGYGLFPGLETSNYFFHKWLCEQVCARYARDGLSVTGIRPGNLMWDDMTAPGRDNDKVVNPLHLLINGHATVSDAARLFSLAIQSERKGFDVYQLSNTTPFANLSMRKAQTELGFQSADLSAYEDFYGRQDWDVVFREALERGIPRDVLTRLEAFKAM